MISTYKYTDESIEHLASNLKTKQNKNQQALCKTKSDRLYYFLGDQKGLSSFYRLQNDEPDRKTILDPWLMSKLW